MNYKQLFATAALAVGIASAAHAGRTAGAPNYTIGGTTYEAVYITGSSAFRGNLYQSVTHNLFDGNNYTLQGKGGAPAADGSTSSYNAYGDITDVQAGGVTHHIILLVGITGSEAGLACLYGTTVNNDTQLAGLGGDGSAKTLFGTPTVATFVDPNNTGSYLATPCSADLAFADTSYKVSLNPGFNSNLKEYGIVGVIPFTWAKGKYGTANPGWTNLVNLTRFQANFLCSGPQYLNYLTGVATDHTNHVYMIGRNKGSGTRVNMMLDAGHAVNASGQVDNWVPKDSYYNSAKQNSLVFGTVQTLSAAGGLFDVVNDGYESGGDVCSALKDDCSGWVDTSITLATNAAVITVGYTGLVDLYASHLLTSGGAVLTDQGVLESDGTVINGTYSFWGHEHLYGAVGQTTGSSAGVVAAKLVGASNIGAPNAGLHGLSTAAGALEGSFAYLTPPGGQEANPETYTVISGASTALDPAVVACDKPSDAGYPSLQ